MRAMYRIAGMVLLAGVVAGCGGNEIPRDWLVSLMPAEPETLNPFTSHDLYSFRLKEIIFDTLIHRDKATLKFVPMLAKSWEISEDKLTYTFHLRDDATFSDGAPLTARDVKFSFETMMDPAVNAPHLRNYYQDVVSCEVLDDFTVQFKCIRPYFKHLGELGEIFIIPRHIYEQGDFNSHPNNRRPIGSGPYVFEKWDTNLELVLARNENYWGKKPAIAKRVYKIITNNDAAFQVLQRGDMDLMGMSSETWIKRASTPEFEAKFNKLEYYRPSYMYIGYNARRPQFDDKRTRRALTMLLDRESIRNEVFHGLARTTTGSFFVDGPEYNKDIEPWPFDPDQAKQLLDEAGWVDSDNDGVRDRDGVSLSFEFLLTKDSPSAEKTATVFQEELKRAGIRMTIRQLEWNTFLESVKTQKFDSCTLGWSLTPDSDPYQIWHSSQCGENSDNSVGFVNAEADEIMEKARLEFDPAKRYEMYQRFHEIIHEEQPVTFLFCLKALVAVDKRFENVEVYPYGLDALEWTIAE